MSLRRAAWAATLCGLLAWAAALPAEDALLDEARALAGQNRYEAALDAVDRFLASAPADERGRFLKGVLLVEAGRSDEAIAVFKALVADHPELPEPHNNLAVLYAARGDYADARDALLSAINTHPSYAIAHENLGDIYAKLAGIAYDKALSLDDSNATARAKLALVDELFTPPSAGAVAEPPVQVAAAAVPAPVATEPVSELPPPPDNPLPAAEPVETPTPTLVAAPEPEPVASAAPEPVAEQPSAAPAAGAAAAVRGAVADWANAWAEQDVTAYLRHYGRGFSPPDGMSRSAWEAQRRERLRAPRFIELAIDDLDVEMRGVDRARAVFTQSYRSDTYSDRVRKVLGLALENGDWRIVSEVSD